MDNCVIFDIDGTLTKGAKDRSPYDWLKVENDELHPVIGQLYSTLSESYSMIICSGRDEICREQTITWLKNNGIVGWNKLYMRPLNDFRKDCIVKEEFWNEISKEYNILFMVDDRKQVIDHARSLGYIVLDVAGNTF